MIKAEKVALSDTVSQKLQDWLGKPELNTLIKVAEAYQKTAEAEALKLADMTLEYPLKAETANKAIQEAHRYADFITILQKIASQTEFNDVKLT